MSHHSIQLASFVVAVFTLVVLCIYAWLTSEISRAATEQAEAMQKPCVILRSMLRDVQEATINQTLNQGGIRGDLLLGAISGQVVLQNIGTGTAVNVAYVFEKKHEPENLSVRSEGSISTLSRDQTISTHVLREIFRGHAFDCTVTYESLSKRQYETRISVNDLVLGEFKFRQMGLWARQIRSFREWQRRRQVPRPKPIV